MLLISSAGRVGAPIRCSDSTIGANDVAPTRRWGNGADGGAEPCAIGAVRDSMPAMGPAGAVPEDTGAAVDGMSGAIGRAIGTPISRSGAGGAIGTGAGWTMGIGTDGITGTGDAGVTGAGTASGAATGDTIGRATGVSGVETNGDTTGANDVGDGDGVGLDCDG